VFQRMIQVGFIDTTELMSYGTDMLELHVLVGGSEYRAYQGVTIRV
jgi:hypothetical protein